MFTTEDAVKICERRLTLISIQISREQILTASSVCVSSFRLAGVCLSVTDADWRRRRWRSCRCWFVLLNLRSLVDSKVIGISEEIPLEFTNRVEFTVQ